MNGIETLYLSMHSEIAAMVARIVPSHDVEDIVQETYLRLRRVLASQEIRHPRAYIYQTARNLALDSLKKGGNTRPEEWCDDADYAATRSDVTADAIDSHRSFERLCDAIECLPERAQQVFVMKKVYGYSQREISTELGIAESTVEKHVSLATRRCNDFMTKDWFTRAAA